MASKQQQTPPEDQQTPPEDQQTPPEDQQTPPEDGGDDTAPEREARQEKLHPVRYRAGQVVDQPLYGTLDPQGRVTPTGNQGRDELAPGARGRVLVQKGRKVPGHLVDALNRTT